MSSESQQKCKAKWMAAETPPAAYNDIDFFLSPLISTDADTFSGPKDRDNLAKKNFFLTHCIWREFSLSVHGKAYTKALSEPNHEETKKHSFLFLLPLIVSGWWGWGISGLA